MESTTSIKPMTSIVRPVSSLTSRTTASLRLSPHSRWPPGMLHSSSRGGLARLIRTTSPWPFQITAPTPTTGLEAAMLTAVMSALHLEKSPKSSRVPSFPIGGFNANKARTRQGEDHALKHYHNNCSTQRAGAPGLQSAAGEQRDRRTEAGKRPSGGRSVNHKCPG